MSSLINMVKKEKHGKLPVNARISIDYGGKEPKVKFSYPRKDVVDQNSGLIALALIFVFLFLLVFLKIMAGSIVMSDAEYPGE